MRELVQEISQCVWKSPVQLYQTKRPSVMDDVRGISLILSSVHQIADFFKFLRKGKKLSLSSTKGYNAVPNQVLNHITLRKQQERIFPCSAAVLLISNR